MGSGVGFIIYIVITAFLLVVLNRVVPEKERNEGWGYAASFVSIIIWPVMIIPTGVVVILGVAYISIEWLLNKMLGDSNRDNVSRETNDDDSDG